MSKQILAEPKESVAIETTILTIDARLLCPNNSTAYIWMRAEGIDSATLPKEER